MAGLIAVGAGVYFYERPSTEQQPPQVTDQLTVEAGLTDSIVVSKPTPLYERGKRLEQHPMYFTDLNEALRLRARISVPTNRDVNINYNIRLRTLAERNGKTVWENHTVLLSGQDIINGGSENYDTTVNIFDLSDRLDDVEEIVGTIASIRAMLIFEATYTAPAANGSQYHGDIELTRELRIVNNAYWVEGETTARATEKTVVPGEMVSRGPDLQLVGGLASGSVGFFFLAVVIERYRRRLPPVETLEFTAQQSELSEWITHGQWKHESTATYIYIDSLQGLVDIAMDTHRRVVYDDTRQIYTVAVEHRIYIYTEQ